MSSREYPDVIDLVETSDGLFMPGVVNTPISGAIVPYRAAPIQTYQVPSSPPRYQSGSRGLSDADLTDFGTDAFGRPTVTRHPITGRAQWNPEIDYAGPSFGNRQSTSDFFDVVPDSRRARRGVVAALDAIPVIGEVIEPALAIQEATNQGIGWLYDVTGVSGALQNAIDRLYGRQSGAPSGYQRIAGNPAFEGGQCNAVIYRGTYQYHQAGTGLRTAAFPDVYGPITEIYTSGEEPSKTIGIRCRGDARRSFSGSRPPIKPPGTAVGLRGSSVPLYSNVSIISLTRVDGLSDDCGNPAGIPTDTPVAPTGTHPTTDYPPEYRTPESPEAPRLPDAPGDYEAPEQPEPDYPALPEVPELPEPENPTEQPAPPTPEPDCCPSTERSLDAIKLDLQKILEKLQGSGDGALDLTPCEDSATPISADYSGEGLTGIYSAIAAIEQSLNFIAGNTKCPPEVTAALPMFWEAKRGEIPQLVVSWRKLEGTDSKWSMNIPHPNETVDADYAFNFPNYVKGPTTCTLRLTDNSYLLVNAANEAEGEKVINYCLTLIDPAYIPTDRRVTITKNAATFQEVAVKAVHVKAFLGHKNTAPLWAKRLTT